VIDMMKRYHGRVSQIRKNAIQVIFPEPPPFSPSLRLVVAFERKALDYHPDAVLAIHGSPFYLKLLDLAREKGGVSRVYTPIVEPLPSSPAERLVDSHADITWVTGQTVNHPHVLYNFAISYQSVVTSDDLISVGYDVVLKRFRHPAVIDALHSVWSETLPSSPGDWAETEAPEPESLVGAVLEELDRRTSRKVARARRNIQKYLENEVRNVEEYYRQLIAEEREAMNRLSNSSPEDAREREKKIQRHQLDWKRRIAEESRHYQCRVHMRLVNASVVYMPRTDVAITLKDGTEPSKCHFNHFLGTLDGIVCEKTGGELGPWQIDESGQWISRVDSLEADDSSGEDGAGDGLVSSSLIDEEV